MYKQYFKYDWLDYYVLTTSRQNKYYLLMPFAINHCNFVIVRITETVLTDDGGYDASGNITAFWGILKEKAHFVGWIFLYIVCGGLALGFFIALIVFCCSKTESGKRKCVEICCKSKDGDREKLGKFTYKSRRLKHIYACICSFRLLYLNHIC